MHVALISPHLDDAVLSLGGTVNRLVRLGADVTIATVFAGDTTSMSASSYWDARRSPTHGAAVRQRQEEDAAAAGTLGASVLAFPWADNGYAARRDPDAIWGQLRSVVERADVVLTPGWPLRHADHRYVTLLLMERMGDSVPLMFYAEYPYAAAPPTLLKGLLRCRTPVEVRHVAGRTLRWRRSPLERIDVRAAERAHARYRGELDNLGARGRWGRAVQRLHGEWLGDDHDARVPVELGLAPTDG